MSARLHLLGQSKDLFKDKIYTAEAVELIVGEAAAAPSAVHEAFTKSIGVAVFQCDVSGAFYRPVVTVKLEEISEAEMDEILNDL